MSKRMDKFDFIIRQGGGFPGRDSDTGWWKQVLFQGPTAFLDELIVHQGQLQGRVSPHPPHRHDHEELHFALSNHMAFMCEDGEGEAQDVVMAAGDVYFKDADEPHTMRNVSDAPQAYFHLRWRSDLSAPGGKRGVHFYFEAPSVNDVPPVATKGFPAEWIVYSGPTRFLSRFVLKCLRFPLQASVPLHRHDHENLFVLIQGVVQVLGRKVEAPAFAYMGSWVPHCLSNPGPEPALLYALEFHRPSG